MCRESVGAAEVQVGSSEKQRAHHRFLHEADPGGAQVPARQPDRTPRHQGNETQVVVLPVLFLLLYLCEASLLLVRSLADTLQRIEGSFEFIIIINTSCIFWTASEQTF